MSESDAKFDESVFEFINRTWREYEEELYYDASIGELMIKELVEAARQVEMEAYKSTKCTRKSRSRSAGRRPAKLL